MVSLILAIASSALISVLMRAGEKKTRSSMCMFTCNYAVCTLLSLLFAGSAPVADGAAGQGTALLLGVLSGALYLTNFTLLNRNIGKNGVVLSAAYMKLGVLIPTLMAIVCFGDRPGAAQIGGIALAVGAILVMYYEKGGTASAGSRTLLILLLLSSGITDSMANLYEKLGAPEWKDRYLLFTFACAGLLSLILWLVRERKEGCAWDVLLGVLVGIPNYFSARFLLQALHTLPASVVYPVYSAATIAAVAVCGIVLFGEKTDRRKRIALGLILAALVLLNL